LSELHTQVNSGDPRWFQNWANSVGLFFGVPMGRVRFSFSSESADKRTVTAQVIDRVGNPRPEYWYLMLHISTGAYNAPAGTSTIGTPSSGVLIKELTSGQVAVFQTDSTGKVVFTLEVAGAATRHFHGIAVGPLDTSGAVTWVA